MAKVQNYLTRSNAVALDEDLMGPDIAFTLEQLMELSGLSVAHAVLKCFPLPEQPLGSCKPIRVCVCCGPGNNGGDGLVAARHLKYFGYDPVVFYPKEPIRDPYQRLLRQLESVGVYVLLDTHANNLAQTLSQCDLIVDAFFGFSFHGLPRSPFGESIQIINDSSLPIVSVDIPSGWDPDVEVQLIGPVRIREPEVLVSLTAPKRCATVFRGIHFLGGRFIPPQLAHRYGLDVHKFPPGEEVIRLSI